MTRGSGKSACGKLQGSDKQREEADDKAYMIPTLCGLPI